MLPWAALACLIASTALLWFVTDPRSYLAVFQYLALAISAGYFVFALIVRSYDRAPA